MERDARHTPPREKPRRRERNSNAVFLGSGRDSSRPKEKPGPRKKSQGCERNSKAVEKFQGREREAEGCERVSKAVRETPGRRENTRVVFHGCRRDCRVLERKFEALRESLRS